MSCHVAVDIDSDRQPCNVRGHGKHVYSQCGGPAAKALPAGRSYVPPAANYGAEQMLRQVRQAVSWTYPLDVLTIVWLHLPYDAMGDIDAFYENTANQTAGNSCPLIL